MPKNPKAAKQLTLDNLLIAPKKATETASQAPAKRIIIIEFSTATKEDELLLKVGFKLAPSKTVFSKIKFDLWFDNQPVSSDLIRILQGPLAADDLELTPVLDMKGVPAGSHTVKVEMYELWSSGERLCQAIKEMTVDYVPLTRADRLVKVPSVKSVAGADLAVVSENQKNIYLDIEKTMKKEHISKRDDW
jgi:hypothetical protein